ncbi:MAG: hydrogenase maturation protease [Clostridiales bacterium]|jgi:hydrogenase maturation protease|nr:hydrogenase maturation protease [Clostridiales bacterium]
MSKILVLGIGSRIMMDDGIGAYLVEDLEKYIKNMNIEFIIGETDIDYCVSKISTCNTVVVIDAYLSGKTPGEVSLIQLCDLKKESNVSYSLHGIHFLNIIQCLKNEPEGILIGIEPYEINFGFSLSHILQKCYPNIFESVYGHVNKFIELYGGMKNA